MKRKIRKSGEDSLRARAFSTRRRTITSEPLEPRRLLSVTAHFFNNQNWMGAPAAAQQMYDVNVNWGVNSPDPAVRNDGFSAAFTGRIFAPVSGTYTFVTQTDDDGFLFVNGTLVSQDPGAHSLRLAPNRTPISLVQGSSNDFIFYYRDRTVSATAVMNWVTPGNGGVIQPVPGYLIDSFSSYSDAPNAPENLTATASGPLGVSLKWTGDPAHATNYQIDRSTDGVSFSPLAFSPFVSTTGDGTIGVPQRYTDGSVHPGQTYYYRVRAGNFDFQSDYSSIVSAVTPALTAVSGVESHFYNQQLWNGSPQWGAVVPNINMSLNAGAGPAPTIQSQDYSSIFTGLLNVTTPGTYTLLSNTDDDGYLYVDGALVALDPGTHVRRNPSNFTPVFLSTGTHDIILEQNQGSSASGASLLYSGPDTGGSLVVAGSTVLSPVSDVPAMPTTLSAFSVASDSITLHWQDNSISETGYTIERSSDGVNFLAVGQTGAIANPSPGVTGTGSYVDSVDPGTQYVYRVRAINFDGQSVSGTLAVTTPNHTLTDIDYSSGFTPGGLILDGYKSFDSPHPSFNSPATITADGRLRLTDDQLGESRGAFTAARVPVDVFSTSFIYQARFSALPPDSSSTTFADGATFTIQNYNPGPQGVGYSVSGGLGGQGLGYAGTPSSVAIKLDIFQSTGDPSSSTTGVFTGGSTPLGGVNLLDNGVNLRSGHPIAVTVSYRRDTQTLVTTLMDTVTLATAYEYNYIDIPSIVGGEWAYVGFTGATGGGHATQDISNWKYSGRLGSQLDAPPIFANYGQVPTTLTATLSFHGTPLSNEAVDFNLNGIDLGTVITDGTGMATLNDPALATLDAGYYPLTVSTPGDNLYADEVSWSYVYVSQAFAQLQYTGLTLTTATTAGNATFELQTVLSDTSGGTGDIRNAQVWFYIYGSDGSFAYVPGNPVTLVNPSDNKTGASTTNWMTNLNGASSVSYQVQVNVGGDYYGYGYSMLTASMPANGQTSGGGSMTLGNSAGLYAGDGGSLLNFDLTARDKSGDVKGSVTITYVKTDSSGRKHTYQIQSTAVTSYGADQLANQSNIMATATLSDITDSKHPILIATGLELDVTLTDRGSPGTSDSLAFTLWGGGTLYFSSDWSGLGTVEDKLKNGNVVAH